MNSLRNPRWLLVINTIPILIMMIIYYAQFQIIKSQLRPESLEFWKSFGTVIGVMFLINLAYTIYLIVKKESVGIYFAVSAFLCYLPILYLYGYHADDIIPFDIPEWMIASDTVFYVGTFLMPTLAYALFIAVLHFTNQKGNQKAWKNFLLAVAIPISIYLFSQVALPLWQPFRSEYVQHVGIIASIILTVAFLFFLVRGILIIAYKKSERWKKFQLLWKIPITIILPLVGLALNNAWFGKDFFFGEGGIIGDFSNPWFYILAIINGIILCLPNLQHSLYRLVLFIARVITFCYTLYFFFVFLPLLPLSLFAVVIVGTGFLMLTPIVLFIIHAHQLSQDFQFLRQEVAKPKLYLLAGIAFLLIPSIITVHYLMQKRNLHKVLEYTYSPDYSKTYDINTVALQRTLFVVNRHKERTTAGLISGIPFLSSYFNWLVLDNLTLSNKKLSHIERIFFGESSFFYGNDNWTQHDAQITDLKTRSQYNLDQKAWISWIDLEITNAETRNLGEYASTFELPEGAWISDYYLYVGDRKEMGILAEKKTATWIYNSIKNENRDPGILYYLTGNQITFKVFPFAKSETRRTGIEIIHKDPIRFEFDKHDLTLGTFDESQEEKVENELAIYVPASLKKSLPKIQRKPYYHFLIDASTGVKLDSYKQRISTMIANASPDMDNAKMSLVNSEISTLDLDSDWENKLTNSRSHGGFFLERALKTSLMKAYSEAQETYPIFITVTDTIQDAIISADLRDWAFTCPEMDQYFHLKSDGKLDAYSLFSTPLVPIGIDTTIEMNKQVLRYNLDAQQSAYLANNGEASIVLKGLPTKVSAQDISSKNWASGLSMEAVWRAQILSPQSSSQHWVDMVRNSFKSQIMTPVTSYLVVENEAQKALLKKKQEQVLSGHKSLDISDDTRRMSEPGLWIMALLMLLILWIRGRRNRQRIEI